MLESPPQSRDQREDMADIKSKVAPFVIFENKAISDYGEPAKQHPLLANYHPNQNTYKRPVSNTRVVPHVNNGNRVSGVKHRLTVSSRETLKPKNTDVTSRKELFEKLPPQTIAAVASNYDTPLDLSFRSNSATKVTNDVSFLKM